MTRRSIRALAAALAGLAAAATAAAVLHLGTARAAEPGAPVPGPAPATGPERTIRVSGEGQVRVRPDVAVIFAGVEGTGKDLARVSADVALQVRKLLAALEKAGVAEKDVQTTRHDINLERPWVDGKQGPITGYTVVDELKVTVRDLAKLPVLLERVVAAGANSLRGLSFQKDDPAPERARALAEAVTAARAKAEVIAKAAGVALGPVLQASEAQGGGPIVPMVRMSMAKADGAPVAPGEVEVGAQVEVVFGIR